MNSISPSSRVPISGPGNLPGRTPPNQDSNSEPSPNESVEITRYGSFRAVVVAANRQLFEPTIEGAYTRTAGGLAAAIHPVLAAKPGSAFVSWDVPSSDKHMSLRQFEDLVEQGNGRDRPYDAIGIDLSPKEKKGYYAHFSNGLLWPIMHTIPERSTKTGPEDWDAYRNVNAKFAHGILSRTSGDALVWVHDYQLMLVPGMIRSGRPESAVGYFHHVPFPEPEILSQHLTIAQQISLVRGLLGSDLIGFHTEEYAHNFLRTVRELGLAHFVNFSSCQISFEGRTVKVGVFPISVDVPTIEAKMQSQEVMDHAHYFQTRWQDCPVVMFGVERLDYTKGLEERFLAIRSLLREKPELIGQVRLIQFAPPSRTEVEEYQDLRTRLPILVEEINAEFRRGNWQPIEFYQSSLGFDQVLGYASAANMIVVTPIKDGMNLVIKEAIMAAQPETVFVLGDGAGAARELTECVLVDAKRPESIAHGYLVGINLLSSEDGLSKIRHDTAVLKDKIRRSPIALWRENFLAAADQAVDRRYQGLQVPDGSLEGMAPSNIDRASPSQAPTFSIVNRRPILSYVEYADPALLAGKLPFEIETAFALDYDGCATEIIDQPNLAKVSSERLDQLRRLARSPRTHLAIVSGRPVQELSDFLDALRGENLLLCGLHGGHIIDHRTGEEVRRPNENLRLGVTEFKSRLLSGLTQQLTEAGLTGSIEESGLILEDKEFTLTLHFRGARALEGIAMSAFYDALTATAEGRRFEMKAGKMAIELVPRGISKGNATEYFINRVTDSIGFSPHPVYIGDDATDEDGFSAVEKLAAQTGIPGTTVYVGERLRHTLAEFRLPSVDAVYEFLGRYLER